MGVDLVRQRLRKLPVSDSLRLKLLHMIVSHHGKYEWQSPKNPNFWKRPFCIKLICWMRKWINLGGPEKLRLGRNWTPYNRQLERYIFTG